MTETIKPTPKPGRTLLIKSKTNDKINLSLFDNLPGLLAKSEQSQNNSVFLTFDTIAHSEAVYVKFSSSHNVKYSYYKIFFTLTSNIDNTNYESAKTELMKFIESSTDSSMLYCKFYRKGEAYMNCGDLIVDKIDAMKSLISKESPLKQFKTEKLSGTFYRFNNSKYKTEPAGK